MYRTALCFSIEIITRIIGEGGVYMEQKIRSIKRITKGQRAVDGAGVHLVRVLGYHDTKEFDPFLMLDAFDSKNPEDYIKGFPWHPHRGIETITYLIEGRIEHGDSLGNHGSILAGECQWMTAGSGIIHQEMPKASKRMLGAQLWLNLPAKDKMTTPRYGDIKQDQVPILKEDNHTVRIISGQYLGHQGAFQGQYIQATYLDVTVEPNSTWSYTTPKDENLFVYIVEGEAGFGDALDQLIEEKHAVLFTQGEQFLLQTKEKSIRCLLFMGKPLHEPIAWGGPIVMNTREELDLAFRELDENTFVKHREKSN
mgnify:FL=1